MEHQKSGGNLLRQVTSLPTRILKNHDLLGLSSLLLHHLCAGECFNLSKAAYFVDNPDFDQLVGVAGFARDEAAQCDVWDEPQKNTTQVCETAFHQKVRGAQHPSVARTGLDASMSPKLVRIAQDLGIDNPQVYSWEMKHGNHGVLLYNGGEHDWDTQDLYNAASLLSFCPM